jgi:hypothetical protein
MKKNIAKEFHHLNTRFLTLLAALSIPASLAAQGTAIQWGLTLTNINNPITPIVVTNGDGSISITAGGGDTYGAPDSFTYAYQQVTGDFDIRVRVMNVTATDPANQGSPKGSLMVRSTLAANSYDFMINALPLSPSSRNGQIESIGRINLAIDTDDLPGRGYNYAYSGLADQGQDGGDQQGDTTDYSFCTYPDVWLRIQRQGEELTSYYATTNATDYGYDLNPGSTNGWQILCSVHADPTNFPSTLYVGLSTVAHNSDITDTADTVTATYAGYGPTPTPASNPSVNGAPAIPGTGPGAFPITQVLAASIDASVSSDGMGYPPNIVQSNQSAPQQIIWNDGGFSGVSRDIIANITAETPGAYCFARYQAGAFDFMLNPSDPVAAVQNLGPYSNPARERYSSGGTNVAASQAWAPSPNYGFAFTTVNKSGEQWNDGADPFYAATYVQLDPVGSGEGYDMVGGHFRGGQFYTRTTKLVTGNINANSSGPGSGSLQRCAIPIALAWFPYAQGWKAGYFDEWNASLDPNAGVPHWKYGDGWGLHSGTALAGEPVLAGQEYYNSPTNLLDWIPGEDQEGNSNYLAKLSLPGVDSLTDGMLFTTGNQEGQNNSIRGPSAQNAALPDGSGWYVAVRDIDDAKADPTLYADNTDAGSSFSFLYIPFNADNLIGGHIATNGTTIKGAGNFSVTHLTNGVYAITIPGKTATNGVLLLQNTGFLDPQPVGYTNVVDNSFLSYEYGGTNTPSNAFIVQTRYVNMSGGGEGVVELRDAQFNFVYVDFLNPLAPPGTLPPVLQLTSAGGNATISWSNGPGFVLQKTGSLSKPITWTDVGTNNPTVLPIAAGGPQFYRVRHP